jgi:prepilin signal peptidase PulO-like enzyme (type II secretory pathway)
MEIFYQVLFFIIGTVFGSFLYVIVIRTHKNTSWIKGRSECTSCKHELSSTNLIPVFSYIKQKGKCAYCGVKLSKMYPTAELVSGVITYALFAKFGFSLEFIVSLITFYLLFILLFSDINYFELPDIFTLPTIVLAFLYSFIFTEISLLNIIMSGVGGGLFFFLQYLLSKGKAMGDGDIRLGVLIGFLLPFPGVLFVILAAYVLGSIVSLVLIVMKRLKRNSMIPLGAFLIPSLMVSFIFYEHIESIPLIESYKTFFSYI